MDTKKVKKGKGYAGALSNPNSYVAGGEESEIIPTAGSLPFK